MVISNSPEAGRRMGRPKLDQKPTTVRFPAELTARIEALVPRNRKAIFIREAVEARVKYLEELQKHDAKKE